MVREVLEESKAYRAPKARRAKKEKTEHQEASVPAAQEDHKAPQVPKGCGAERDREEISKSYTRTISAEPRWAG